ncbi:30S ribosomal protein S9 [bacterium]|jgi:small subunit ribosomal protein S9|nr:30S ribosomal protein S9 [bacterium]MBT6831988.1 30S ribosomal protein S9 [bacterium]MBT6996788.1 30S ribosomal protein S9 [bacterium]MBT7772087.1 30S ribosomal protein S9 [bacterium]
MVKTENRAYFYALGRRKTARASVKLFPEGSGEVEVNGKTLREWADTDELMLNVLQPLHLLGVKKDFDFVIRTSGGGKEAQADAARLGVSRALLKKNLEFRTQLKEADFLTVDSRKKERKKPGLKRARRAPQFSKR